MKIAKRRQILMGSQHLHIFPWVLETLAPTETAHMRLITYIMVLYAY